MTARALTRRIHDANLDWKTRMKTAVYDVQYDYDADILYVAFREPTESFSFPLEDEVNLRIAVDSYEIVGMDVLNVREVFIANNPEIQGAFKRAFEFFGESDWRFEVHHPSGRVDDMVPSHEFVDYFPTYIPRTAPGLVPA